MELIVDFRENEWLCAVFDSQEMIRLKRFDPFFEVDDIVCGRIIEKSKIKDNFFFEYQKGKTGLLIKAKGLKVGDKITATLLRKEEPPFKSAKFAPKKSDTNLDIYQIYRKENPVLNFIKNFDITKITCNPNPLAKIFPLTPTLSSAPFDAIILDEIEAISSPIVDLENGARIIIEKTAAFTAIDVDSAKSNDNAEQINLLAAKEIIRQLYLREIYGQIVIDFIGHAFDKKLDNVINYLKNEKDGIKFISLTRLNLIEIIKER